MVQTKRAEINSDTAVSIAHHRPGARPQGSFLPSYDPENLGAWDGQLPHADFVDQLPPPTERKPGGPMDRDEWRRSNAARVGHAAYKLLDTLTGYSNPEGRCWPGMDLLAEVTGMSARALRYALAELRRKELAWPTYPGFTVSRANPYQLAGGLDGWGCARSCTTIVQEVAQPLVQEVAHRTPSSSNPKKDPKDPGLTDAKRVDAPGPEDGVTTGVLNSFSLEEERTGTGAGAGVTTEDAKAFIDDHIWETPVESQARRYLDHTWAVWEFPANPYGWKHGEEAAIKHVMASQTNWTKFRKDLVVHLAKVGLPKPLPPDPDNDWARGRTSEQFDQLLAEGPKRMVDMKCAGCGKRRQLPPGDTRCQPCRQAALVEVA